MVIIYSKCYNCVIMVGGFADGTMSYVRTMSYVHDVRHRTSSCTCMTYDIVRAIHDIVFKLYIDGTSTTGDVTSAQPAFYVPTIRNSWGK
jgi:hypothetical protein